MPRSFDNVKFQSFLRGIGKILLLQRDMKILPTHTANPCFDTLLVLLPVWDILFQYFNLLKFQIESVQGG
ncbi:hypothetical protein LA10_01497 [Thermotoga neapolitana LA10]|nr:hypothetical protein LA10_01497 [Thermotoga neapolitana LA10]